MTTSTIDEAPRSERGRSDRVLVSATIILSLLYVAGFAYVVSGTRIVIPFSGVPYWSLPYSDYLQSGNLAAYLWLPDNEHHPVWMRLIAMLDFRLGGQETAFAVAAVATLAMLYGLLAREILKAPVALGVAGAAMATTVVFTAWNALDCSIAIYSLYPMTVFFCGLSAVLFCGPGTSSGHPAAWRALALLAAVGASFASGAGLMAFPMLVFASWICGASFAWTAGIAAAGIVFALPYMAGTLAGTPETAARSVIDAFLYWVAYLGLPWTRPTAIGPAALLIGPALLVMALALWLRAKNSRLASVAGCLIFLSLGISILAAVGRSGISDPHPPLRYAVFMTPLHAGLLMLALERWRLKGAVALAFVLVMGVQQLVAIRPAISAAYNLRTMVLDRFNPR
jgi:hypothetical protein